jgi:hypothetical protein
MRSTGLRWERHNTTGGALADLAGFPAYGEKEPALSQNRRKFEMAYLKGRALYRICEQ